MNRVRPLALHATAVSGVVGAALVLAACTPTLPPISPPSEQSPPVVGSPPVAGSPPGEVSPPVEVSPDPSAPVPPAAPQTPAAAGGLERGVGARQEQPDAGTELTSVAALPAQAFTDSVCVNTHFGYGDTPYGRYDEVSALLVDAGIRHIRDGGTSAAALNAIPDLAARGVRTTYIMNPSANVIPDESYWPDNGILLADVLDQVGVESVDAVEIGNEWNLTHGTVRRSPDSTGPLSSEPVDGGNGYREFATALTGSTREALDAKPETADVPVFAPSYTNGGDYLDGGYVPGADYANIHAYQAGRNPETPGWGDNGYGSRDWQMRNGQAQTEAGAIVITEGGYSNAVNQNTQNIPEDVHGRYLPRLFLHYFDGGVDQFCSYELLDEWDNTARDDAESNFGMLRNDLSPKPAYTAVRSMMSATADTGTETATGPATMQYAVSDPDVEQLLLQKSDGSYVLALWQGAASWDPNAGAPIGVADVPVTITLPDASAVTADRLGDTGELANSAVTLDGGTADLMIGDEVTFLQIS